MAVLDNAKQALVIHYQYSRNERRFSTQNLFFGPIFVIG